jgi:hypothetical protein
LRYRERIALLAVLASIRKLLARVYKEALGVGDPAHDFERERQGEQAGVENLLPSPRWLL